MQRPEMDDGWTDPLMAMAKYNYIFMKLSKLC